jgi:hypothetical protein
MSAKMDWKKAKKLRPQHKKAEWLDDPLALRAKRELRKWTRRLSPRQRRAWEAVR